MKRFIPGGLLPPLAVAFALVFSACEGSPVPLSDPPSIAVDSSLVGLWEIATVGDEPADEDQKDRMLVLPFNAHEYYVEYYGTDPKGSDQARGDTSRYRVYLSDVQSRLVANIQCIQCGDDRDFLFMLAEPGAEQLRLTTFDSGYYAEFKEFTSARQAHDRMARAFVEGIKLEEPAVFHRIGRLGAGDGN